MNLFQRLTLVSTSLLMLQIGPAPGDGERTVADAHPTAGVATSLSSASSSDLALSTSASSSASGSSARTPSFLIQIDIPKYALQVLKDGQLILSGPVAVGASASPVMEVEQNQIIYFPKFFPTRNEILKGMKPANPDTCLSCPTTHNPLGHHKIPIQGVYGIHGTNRPESVGHNASGGCFRAGDYIGALCDTLRANLPVRSRSLENGRLTQRYFFSKTFKIRTYYALWDSLSIQDSALALTIWPDVHHRLTRAPPADCPVRADIAGNAYRLEHLLRDASAQGYRLREGLTPKSEQVQLFWKTLESRLIKNNRPATRIQLPQTIFKR